MPINDSLRNDVNHCVHSSWVLRYPQLGRYEALVIPIQPSHIVGCCWREGHSYSTLRYRVESEVAREWNRHSFIWVVQLSPQVARPCDNCVSVGCCEVARYFLSASEVADSMRGTDSAYWQV